jgi:NADH-quinone oxidoreductase subunit N
VSADYAALARALGAETALVVAALVVLAIDLAWMRGASKEKRRDVAALVGATGCVAALAWCRQSGAPGDVWGGVLILDTLAVAARVGVLVLLLGALGVLCGGAANRNPAEQVALTLLGGVGLLLMPAAQNLLLAFVALELASLSLYLLVGFDKRSAESAEAGLKYFLVGGVTAACLLFGLSLIYGLTGTLSVDEMAGAVRALEFSPLAAVAVTLVVVALGFKVAAAPFHAWAPDAYQGAPTPVAAWVASGSKVAALVLFYRLLWPGLHGWAGAVNDVARIERGWLPIVLVVALASMALGNLVALAQRDVRRLLAYSAIGHAGVMLLALVLAGSFGVGTLVYYVFTYALATLGTFGVLAAAERDGRRTTFESLAGLHARSPLLAWCLAIFVLSLAGIPPTSGFFGKLFVFAEAFRVNGIAGPVGWAALAGIGCGVVGLYYYLVVLRAAFVATTADGTTDRVHVRPVVAVVLVLTAALVVALGVFPIWMLRLF